MAGKNTNPDRVISNHVDGFKQGVKTFLAVLWGVPVMMMAGSPVAVAAVPDTISSQTVSTIHKAKAYSPMQLNFLKPADILPIVGQVELGDDQVYEHIEHLGIAEATKIRDMMRAYGAGSYTPQEYQQLMARLHTGMTMEEPEGYDNYETIGEGYSWGDPSNHATCERNILNSIIDDKANFIVQNKGDPWWGSIKERVDANPNHIYIFGNSIFGISDKAWWISQNRENLKSQLARSKNFLIFAAGTNINKKNGVLKNKINHGDIIGDENGEYSLPSYANGSKNKDPKNHIIITVGTDYDGDINKSISNAGSKFPVGFHSQALFAGREFPYHDNKNYGGRVVADYGIYATSYPNYLNVAMASLCFQMGADIEDVDALLDRMRTTALTDYIRFDLNGDGDTDDIVQVDTDDGHIDQPETQPLQLINPAGVFKKYNMPQELPTEIKIGETLPLNKHFYNGVAFLIAGAEVLINGQWIAFSNENSTLVMAENPMTLQWRLNGELMQQYGYSDGDTIEGTIVAVDDEWNGLNHLSKTFSVMLKGNVTGVGGIEADSQTASNVWYTISGQKLSKRPTTPGVYIRNGKKLVVK